MKIIVVGCDGISISEIEVKEIEFAYDSHGEPYITITEVDGNVFSCRYHQLVNIKDENPELKPFGRFLSDEECAKYIDNSDLEMDCYPKYTFYTVMLDGKFLPSNFMNKNTTDIARAIKFSDLDSAIAHKKYLRNDLDFKIVEVNCELEEIKGAESYGE